MTLDPATGAVVSIIGNLGLVAARALAFDDAGTLYVSGQTSTLTPQSLFTVDVTTAAKTLVGGPIFSNVALAGMDFSPGGTLYGVALRNTGADGGLLSIDKSTGAGTLLFTSGRLNQQGIRFAPQRALDHDLDGIHDIVDCSPADPLNGPPGPVGGLDFTDSRTFTFSPAPGGRFHNTYAARSRPRSARVLPAASSITSVSKVTTRRGTATWSQPTRRIRPRGPPSITWRVARGAATDRSIPTRSIRSRSWSPARRRRRPARTSLRRRPGASRHFP